MKQTLETNLGVLEAVEQNLSVPQCVDIGNEAHTRIIVANQLKGSGDPEDSSDDSSP